MANMAGTQQAHTASSVPTSEHPNDSSGQQQTPVRHKAVSLKATPAHHNRPRIRSWFHWPVSFRWRPSKKHQGHVDAQNVSAVSQETISGDTVKPRQDSDFSYVFCPPRQRDPDCDTETKQLSSPTPGVDRNTIATLHSEHPAHAVDDVDIPSTKLSDDTRVDAQQHEPLQHETNSNDQHVPSCTGELPVSHSIRADTEVVGGLRNGEQDVAPEMTSADQSDEPARADRCYDRSPNSTVLGGDYARDSKQSSGRKDTDSDPMSEKLHSVNLGNSYSQTNKPSEHCQFPDVAGSFKGSRPSVSSRQSVFPDIFKFPSLDESWLLHHRPLARSADGSSTQDQRDSYMSDSNNDILLSGADIEPYLLELGAQFAMLDLEASENAMSQTEIAREIDITIVQKRQQDTACVTQCPPLLEFNTDVVLERLLDPLLQLCDGKQRVDCWMLRILARSWLELSRFIFISDVSGTLNRHITFCGYNLFVSHIYVSWFQDDVLAISEDQPSIERETVRLSIDPSISSNSDDVPRFFHQIYVHDSDSEDGEQVEYIELSRPLVSTDDFAFSTDHHVSGCRTTPDTNLQTSGGCSSPSQDSRQDSINIDIDKILYEAHI